MSCQSPEVVKHLLLTDLSKVPVDEYTCLISKIQSCIITEMSLLNLKLMIRYHLISPTVSMVKSQLFCVTTYVFNGLIVDVG